MNSKLKRIAALISVILLVGLSISTLIVACLDFPGKSQVFFAMMGSTIFLPIILWILIWMFGLLTNKKTIASFRSEEMDQTMAKAKQIKEEKEKQEETP